MSGEAVVDANVVLAWLFEEPNGELWDDAFANYSVIVPLLSRLEVVNGLLKSERRRSLTRENVDLHARWVDDLLVTSTESSAASTAEDIVAFARPHQLSSYDAAYVVLALERGATLFTNDSNMLDAAGRLGLPVRTA